MRHDGAWVLDVYEPPDRYRCWVTVALAYTFSHGAKAQANQGYAELDDQKADDRARATTSTQLGSVLTPCESFRSKGWDKIYRKKLTLPSTQYPVSTGYMDAGYRWYTTFWYWQIQK